VTATTYSSTSLAKALTVEQFKAVLAHEFGHLSEGHGRISKLIEASNWSIPGRTALHYLAAPVAKIRRRNGDLFWVKWPDCHRRNHNRADAGAAIMRRDGVVLNPYKQGISPHACAVKSALARCGIDAMCRALVNELQ
jgi:Peptidase family M48